MTLTQIKPAGLSKPIELADTEKITFGDSNDLQIHHTNNNSFINDTGAGQLMIQASGLRLRNYPEGHTQISCQDDVVELYYNNSKKLSTSSSGIQVEGSGILNGAGTNTTTLTLKNATDTTGTKLGHSSNSDRGFLQVTEAGADFGIQVGGANTSNMRFEAFGDSSTATRICFGTEEMITAAPNGAVELYYDNSKKFDTNNLGVRTHGTHFLNGDVQFANDGFTDGILWDKSGSSMRWKDNNKALFGDGEDLQIYHDSSSGGKNYIESPSTDFAIRVANGNRIEINGTTGDVTMQGSSGKNFFWDHSAAYLNLNDNARVTFGTSNDFQIYHDGTNTILNNTVGSLAIRNLSGGNTDLYSNADTRLLVAAGEIAVQSYANGAVQLRYDNSTKFETTSIGAKVTGKLGVGVASPTSELEVQGANHSNFRVLSGNSDVIGFFQTVQGTELRVGTSTNSPFKLFVNGVDRVHLDTSGNVNIPNDSGKFQSGASNDLQIYHDGSHSRIVDTGTGNLNIQGSQVSILNAAGTENMLVAYENNRVDLYNNNVKCARTISTDVNGFLVGDDTNINDSIGHGELIVRRNLSSPAEPSITQCARATIITNEQTAGPNGYGGALFFGGQDVDTSGQYTVDLAAIGATTNGNDIANANASGFLDFYTRNGSTFGHKFRIEQDGDLLGTDTSIGSLSDSRLKENIEDFTFDINKFKQFQPKLFNWKHPEYHRDTPASGKHRGFIAQDLEVIDSELVTTYRIPKENPESALVDQITIETEEYKQVVAEGKTSNLGRIDAMYISVINQLIAKVEALETKVAVLEAK